MIFILMELAAIAPLGFMTAPARSRVAPTSMYNDRTAPISHRAAPMLKSFATAIVALLATVFGALRAYRRQVMMLYNPTNEL